ncbi:MAG: hypothetical protein H6604_02845 [Flavobacteriales bacterium]|nr:hypothetical protein [Flavobacteriales bacterium]
MRLITFLTLFISSFTFSQNDKYWYRFDIEDTTINSLSSTLGFKDIKGNIKIKPAFLSPLTRNKRFEKVVAVTEIPKLNGKSYYLNKTEKEFGIDSVYTFDFMHDTEQEGFIRFSVGRYLGLKHKSF